ncbi:MAG: hypothetical protein DMG18_15575, partial [Acidobacteria bacterium]
ELFLSGRRWVEMATFKNRSCTEVLENRNWRLLNLNLELKKSPSAISNKWRLIGGQPDIMKIVSGLSTTVL